MLFHIFNIVSGLVILLVGKADGKAGFYILCLHRFNVFVEIAAYKLKSLTFFRPINQVFQKKSDFFLLLGNTYAM